MHHNVTLQNKLAKRIEENKGLVSQRSLIRKTNEYIKQKNEQIK
jgi:hypothetical protein